MNNINQLFSEALHFLSLLDGKKKLFTCVLLLSVLIPFQACKKEEIKFDDNDPVVVTDELEQYGTPFDAVPEVSDITMYEVNLFAFSNNRDIAGVTSKLDHIKDLGINVIWLMPIYPIGQLNGSGSPYSVKDYTAVNSDLGTLDDLRELVEEAHNRGMAVILDWVANHTSWDNEWIEDKSWYTTDESGNIVSPNADWLDVADLNFNSTAMREEMINSMKYWVLEANVDGFRCDHADGVPDDFWKDAIDELRAIPDRDIIMFAEGERKSLYSSGFDLLFGWTFYSKAKDIIGNNVAASQIFQANASEYDNIPNGKHVVRWITNHDDNAWDALPQDLFKGVRGSIAAFVLSTYMNGVPLIYNGQEVGFNQQLGFFDSNYTIIDWTQNTDLYSEYSQIINVKNNYEAFRKGTLESYTDDNVVAFTRKNENETVLVVVNTRNANVTYSVPSSIQNSNWSDCISEEAVQIGETLSLQPFEYLIVTQ